MHYQIDMENAIQSQDWLGAIDLAEQAQFSYPNDLAMGIWTAQAYAELGQYETALQQLETLAAHHPALALPYELARDRARQLNWTPEYHLYAGLAAHRAGDWELAANHWTQTRGMEGMAAKRAAQWLARLPR